MNKEQKLLIEKYIDGELSEQELSLFVDQLREEAELLAELNLAIEMKGTLFCAQHDQFNNLETQVMDNLSQENSSLEESVMSSLPKKASVTAFPNWLKLAIAAQIILIPLFLFIIKPTQQSPAIQPILIAQVSGVKNDCFVLRGKEKLNIKNGADLFSDDQIFVQDESSLQMTYTDGSTLSFSSQSFVRLREINGQKSVELFSGVLDADIQKQASGKDMIISTEHSECEVIGTKFTLSSSDVSALLDVSEGAVRYNKAESTESVMVKADHYASTNSTQNLRVAKSTKPLYRSPEVNYHTPNKRIPIEVDLHGARSLYLVVSNAGNGNTFDHSAWISPKIIGPTGEISLTELPMKISKAGWAEIEINLGFYGAPLRIQGKTFPSGIAAHATSLLAWDIPPGYDTFMAEGALLDSSKQRNNINNIESVRFEVYTSIPEKKLQKLLIRKKSF